MEIGEMTIVATGTVTDPTSEEVVSQIAADLDVTNRMLKAVFHRGTGTARRSRDLNAEAAVKSQFGDEGQIVTRKLFTQKQGLIYQRNQLANDMATYHTYHTLPLGDDGSRLLPNEKVMDYTLTMSNFQNQIEVLDQQIISQYDQLVIDDIAHRNASLVAQGKPPSASTSDYPSLETVRGYLYVTWRLEPVPVEGDFRFMPDGHAREIAVQRHKEYAQEMNKSAKEAVLRKLLTPIERFVNKLDTYNGEKGQRFSDSFITGVADMAAAIDSFNFDGDPRVTALAEEIKKTITPYTFNTDAIREAKEVRDNAKVQMKALMDKFADYGINSGDSDGAAA